MTSLDGVWKYCRELSDEVNRVHVPFSPLEVQRCSWCGRPTDRAGVHRRKRDGRPMRCPSVMHVWDRAPEDPGSFQ